MIDYLAERGTIDAGRIYDSASTAVALEGPEALLPGDVDEFLEIVKYFHDTATA